MYFNRYFRLRLRTPSSSFFTIFSKVYHTFGHTRTCFTTYRKMETPRRTARKFSTKFEGHKSNCRLLSRVLERKNAKRPLTDVPQAYELIREFGILEILIDPDSQSGSAFKLMRPECFKYFLNTVNPFWT